MAFTPSSLHVALDTIAGGALRIHSYATTDDEAAVTAPGYFQDAVRRGLRSGDLVVVIQTNLSDGAYIARVVGVDGAGAATVTADRNLVQEYATDAALGLGNVPPVVSGVRVRGRLAADDGEGGLFVRRGSEPASGRKVQSADGAWWEFVPLSSAVVGFTQSGAGAVTRTVDAKLRERLSLLDFTGADNTGTNSNSAALVAAITECIASKRKLYIPGGLWRFSSTMSVVNPAGDIDIEIDDNAVIFAAGWAGGIFWNFGNSGPSRRLRIVGGYFDVSTQVNVGASDDTIYVTGDWSFVRVRDAEFYAGADYVVSPNVGASAIFVTAIGSSISGCKFTGYNDLGVYASGTTASDRNRACRVSDCEFYRCNAGVADKREGRFLIVTGCYFEECAVGVFTGEAGALNPGRHIVVSHNVFHRCANNIIVRLSDGTTVTGNVISDFGYLLDGVTTQANATGIFIQGSKNCSVTGNTIFMRDLAAFASQRAVWVTSRVQNSVTFNSTGNVFSSNVVDGVRVGFQEENASQDGNLYNDNIVIDFTADYSLLGPNSILTTSRAPDGDGFIELVAANISLGGRKNAESVRVSRVASSVNFIGMQGAAAAGRPTITFNGSDTNVDGIINTKGTGALFLGGGAGSETLRVVKVASQVNAVEAVGAASGGNPILRARGAGTVLHLTLSGKGPGGTVVISGLPTSASGLPAGGLWNDAGALKVA